MILNDMRLQDKVAIVTGAGSGIGEATAILFAEQGAMLVLNDVDEVNGKRVLKLVKKAGGKGAGRQYRCEACDQARVAAMAPRR